MSPLSISAEWHLVTRLNVSKLEVDIVVRHLTSRKREINVYDVQKFIDEQRKPTTATLCYCRVSGKAQADDLASQVEWMRQRFPEAEIIQDFGSGINFKRKGHQRLLERLLRGDKRRSVGAHRDRLARFGSEVIRYLVEQNGGEVVVRNTTAHSPEEELTADLLEIRHVFS